MLVYQRVWLRLACKHLLHIEECEDYEASQAFVHAKAEYTCSTHAPLGFKPLNLNSAKAEHAI